MECPRCRGALDGFSGGSGPFRGNRSGVRCSNCALTVLPAVEAGAAVALRIAKTPLASHVVDVSESCPGCFSPLTRLTVSAYEAWFEIEECPRCGALVLDDDEVHGVRDVLAATEGGASLEFGVVPVGSAHEGGAAREMIEAARRRLEQFRPTD